MRDYIEPILEVIQKCACVKNNALVCELLLVSNVTSNEFGSSANTKTHNSKQWETSKGLIVLEVFIIVCV